MDTSNAECRGRSTEEAEADQIATRKRDMIETERRYRNSELSTSIALDALQSVAQKITRIHQSLPDERGATSGRSPKWQIRKCHKRGRLTTSGGEHLTSPQAKGNAVILQNVHLC
jgi:hypothetical protein